MALSYTVITGTFEDGQGNPLSGTASFTPNVTVYASGIPVLTAGVPITAQITSGQLLAATGGPFQLLASDNSGLGFEGLTGFLIYEVQVDVSGQVLDPWSFALPSSPSPVELYALANTGSGGGGGGSGTVTSVSVASANGLAGTVANPTSTPAITLRTTVTGLLKANGTAISAATSGTDYAPATSGSAILKGDGAGGFASAAAGTDYAPPTSGTPLLKGNGSGGFSAASAGTDYLAPAGNGSQLTGLNVSQVSGAAPLASPTFTGTVTVPTTVNATDAAQKAYVDSVAQGLDNKPSVTVLASANIALTGTQTIDGVAVVAGNRVLATGQSTASQNGIWTVASGAWTRPADFASGSVQLGASVFVEGGTANSSSGWTLVGTSPVTVDSGSQSWTQFSGAGEITAGSGLGKSGNTLSLTATLDQVPLAAGNVSLNSHKVTSLANGSASSDAAAFGQTPAGGSTVTIGQGGTGQVTQQAALDALAGGVTSAQYLRGNGTHVALSAIQAGDVPTLNQNTTGTAANLTGAATFPARVTSHVTALTDGSSVAVDASLGNVFDWPLGAGSHTLAVPSSAVNGDSVVIRIAYSGSFTPLFASGAGGYSFGTDGQPSWTATNATVDLVGFDYNSTLGKWLCTGWKLGFS